MDFTTRQREKASFWTSVNKKDYAVLLGYTSRVGNNDAENVGRLPFLETTVARAIEPVTCRPRTALIPLGTEFYYLLPSSPQRRHDGRVHCHRDMS
jgi:hypothetical protein